MFDELSDYYFHKALALAKNDDLSSAVQYTAASIGMSSDTNMTKRMARDTKTSHLMSNDANASQYISDDVSASQSASNNTDISQLARTKLENTKRLAGLCYYKLGNYTMAEYCFDNSSYYNENVKEVLSKKKEQMNNIKALTDKQQYKKAVKQLEQDEDKNVNEYNYLGCLYAVLNQREKAIKCFLKALREDKSNKDTLRYLENIHCIKKRWWML